MNKKDFVVVFILALVVAMAATCRYFSVPLHLTGERAKPVPARHNTSTAPGKGLKGLPTPTPLWPRLTDSMEPRDPAARRLLDAAETIAGEGILHAAIATYSRFLERFPDEPAAEFVLLRIGLCSTLLGRYKEAAEGYELFLARYPKSTFRPVALLMSGDALAQIGQPQLARKRLTEVVAEHPDSPYAEGAKALLAALDAPPKATSP